MASHPLCPWCLPATGRCSVRNRRFKGSMPVDVRITRCRWWWRRCGARSRLMCRARWREGRRGQARELQALVAARVRGQADIAVPTFLYPWLSTCSPRDIYIIQHIYNNRTSDVRVSPYRLHFQMCARHTSHTFTSPRHTLLGTTSSMYNI